MTVSLLTDFFLPLGGSLFLWFLLVPTIMLCRYCSSLYNNAWHLSLAKSTGQCCVVFLCAKQMENKTTLTRRCSMWCDVFLHATLEFAGVSLPLPRSICVCTSVRGQKDSSVHRWTNERCRRAADAWSDPSCRLSLNHWLQTQRQRQPRALNTLACALMPEVTT